ncbi:MAG TPA: hypothetical protein VHL09_00025 [Dehalococcoidia bacterium]|nr:hypothetical protein [Dehalococcoidia bacterium]
MEPEPRPKSSPRRRSAPVDRLAAVRGRALLELSALAEDVAAHLRRHASPTVRVSAALLLTASLAACASGSATPTTSSDPAASDGRTSPLQGEVKGGLPSSPGRYPILDDQIYRDRKGVFEFTWLDDQRQPHTAYTSDLKFAEVAQGANTELEVPSGGGTPILHLPSDRDIKLIEDSQAAANPSSSYVQHSYPWTSSWVPFAAGMLVGNLLSPGVPGYYYPPPGNYSVGQTIRGGSVRTTPAPPQDRVIGLRSAVSGQSGGTGAGSSVTNKLGRSAGTGATGATGGTGQSGAGSATTGSGTGVTSGQAGGEGSGSAVTGRTGSSGGSSGVTSPSSGGFSSGGKAGGTSGSSSS